MGPIGFGHPSEGLGSSQSLATLRSIQTATSCEVAEVDQPGGMLDGGWMNPNRHGLLLGGSSHLVSG